MWLQGKVPNAASNMSNASRGTHRLHQHTAHVHCVIGLVRSGASRATPSNWSVASCGGTADQLVGAAQAARSGIGSLMSASEKASDVLNGATELAANSENTWLQLNLSQQLKAKNEELKAGNNELKASQKELPQRLAINFVSVLLANTRNA